MIRLPFSEAREIKSAVKVAAEVVAAGGVVLIPTESHYGLGVDPRQPDAVEKVFELKGRPAGLALPVVCSDWGQVDLLVSVPDVHRFKLARIWPAALTVVAPCRRPLAASPTDSLAVRIPDHDGLRALLYRVGPLTATSANRHGEPPIPTADAALDSLLGAPDLVLDAGDLAGGSVSTIMDLSSRDAREIRSGPVLWDEPFDLEDWVLQEG
jgi:tRNA threonylcarbamoyl adenosine modification protein (Sua5/YciO/YrdC/YwlC family)